MASRARPSTPSRSVSGTHSTPVKATSNSTKAFTIEGSNDKPIAKRRAKLAKEMVWLCITLKKFLDECVGGIPPDPQIEAGFADAFKDVDQTRGEVGMYPGLVRPHRNHVGPRIATNEEPDPRHQ